MRLLLLVAFLSVGCGGSLEPSKVAGAQERSEKIGLKYAAAPEPTPFCRGLDSQRDAAGFFGKVFAGAATVSAGSVAYWETEKTDNIAALTAAGAAVVSGALLWFAEAKGNAWAKYCATP